jgi:hypothetical protein
MKRITFALVMATALAAAACLQKDTTSTVYLRPDGSFDWVFLERNVRSDEADSARRLAEEADYARIVAHGRHPVAMAFETIGAYDVATRWLRGSRPYAVMIDARFESLPGMFERVLTRCLVPHQVSLSDAGGVATWRLWMDVGPDGEGLSEPEATDCGEGLDGLIDALDDLHIVLEAGTFTAANGFSLEGTDTAVIDEAALEQAVKASGRVELSLSWRSR